MGRSLGTIGVILAGSFAIAAYACGGGDEGGGGGGGGSGGSTGGAGGAGGTAGDAATCGPTPLGFPGTCKAGAPTQCCGTTLPVMQKRNELDQMVDGNWSCIQGGGTGGGAGAGGSGGSSDAGTEAGGAAGAASDAGSDSGVPPNSNVFEVEDFSSSKPVADIDVELFEGDSIVDKTPFHTSVTKGVDNTYPQYPGLNIGQFYFPHPPSPTLSYRVKEKVGVAKEFVGFGYDVPEAPGKVSGSTLSPTLYKQLAQYAVPLVGWEPPADLAIITGRITDCSDEDMGGAMVRFFDAETNTEMEPGTCERDLRYIYFDSEFPNTKCTYTDYREALFVIANAPSNAAGANKGHKYRIEYWGRLSAADAEPIKFAERLVDIFANTVNVHNIKPNVQQ